MNGVVVGAFALKFCDISLQGKAREIIEYCQAHKWSDDLALMYGTIDFKKEKKLYRGIGGC
jgi:uncharacterized protein HemY